ncbi:unnamed protein product [Mytilus edulis]|uniref:Uncharacterized protein n=1 Tax=Mytilus edulis TaxID=6550 RepID=A0A8S3SH25_MYTED|nr:unnamed protein product [Mytilus edulis]
MYHVFNLPKDKQCFKVLKLSIDDLSFYDLTSVYELVMECIDHPTIQRLQSDGRTVFLKQYPTPIGYAEDGTRFSVMKVVLESDSRLIDNSDTADSDSDITVCEISDESDSDIIGPSPAQKVSSSPFPFVLSQVFGKRRRLKEKLEVFENAEFAFPKFFGSKRKSPVDADTEAVDLAPKAKFRDVLQGYINTAVDCVKEANLLREENTLLKNTP